MKKMFFLLTLTIMFASCNKSNPDGLKTADPILLSQDMYPILSKTTNFSFDFFKRLSETNPDNLFISPYSVTEVLGMLYNGAQGETKNEIATLLGMTDCTPQQINNFYKTLTEELLSVDSKTELCLSNGIWSDKRFPMKSSFINLCKEYYYAEASSLDFSQKAATLKTINDWANKQTKGTIPTILDDLEPSECLILANAIYFKSTWREKFDKSNTSDKPFYNSDGTTSTVHMMHQKELPLLYSKASNFEIVRLPYSNSAFAMSILLPMDNVSIEDVLNSLDGDKWEEANSFANLDWAQVTLSMPRFKLESDLKIKDILEAMGMTTALSTSGDFSYICDQSVFITDISHKSYVDVDESGTTASAVTTIKGELTSSKYEHVTLEVNRPFIFTITEQSTGVILFMGKVNKM